MVNIHRISKSKPANRGEREMKVTEYLSRNLYTPNLQLYKDLHVLILEDVFYLNRLNLCTDSTIINWQKNLLLT